MALWLPAAVLLCATVSPVLAGNGDGGANLRADPGWRLLNERRYQHALDAFIRAARRAPADGTPWLGIAFSQRALGRPEQAVEAGEQALKLEPQLPLAHRLLGDLYLAQDEPAAAAPHYRAALQEDPNDVELLANLRSAEGHAQADAGLDRLFSRRAIVKFKGSAGSDGRALAGVVAERLDRVAEDIGSVIGYHARDRVVVVLHEDRQFRAEHGSAPWVNGFYDGRIHLSDARVADGGAGLVALLRHEYAHAVVRRMSDGRAPTWLDEGLAVYFERKPARPGKSGPPMPLSALHGDFLGLSKDEARAAYAASYRATRVLIDRYGLPAVGRLLEALPQAADFPRAFEQVFRAPYHDFEARWAIIPTKKKA